MDRFEQYLVDDRSRDRVRAALDLFKHTEGLVCTIAPETRSQAQNRLLWPLLTAFHIQEQHYGRFLHQADWKNLFMGALNGAEFVPSLDGRSVMPLHLSTRILNKTRFGELLDLIDATAAERGVDLKRNSNVTELRRG